MSDSVRGKCPDTGTCHHLCGDGPCFRVLCCVPLGIAEFPGDRWPDEIVSEHRARQGEAVSDG